MLAHCLVTTSKRTDKPAVFSAPGASHQLLHLVPQIAFEAVVQRVAEARTTKSREGLVRCNAMKNRLELGLGDTMKKLKASTEETVV